MHIELRENLTKVSEDLKQRMYGQLNKAWSSLAEFTKMPRVLTSNTINSNQNEIESADSDGNISNNNDQDSPLNQSIVSYFLCLYISKTYNLTK